MAKHSKKQPKKFLFASSCTGQRGQLGRQAPRPSAEPNSTVEAHPQPAAQGQAARHEDWPPLRPASAETPPVADAPRESPLDTSTTPLSVVAQVQVQNPGLASPEQAHNEPMERGGNSVAPAGDSPPPPTAPDNHPPHAAVQGQRQESRSRRARNTNSRQHRSTGALLPSQAVDLLASNLGGVPFGGGFPSNPGAPQAVRQARGQPSAPLQPRPDAPHSAARESESPPQVARVNTNPQSAQRGALRQSAQSQHPHAPTSNPVAGMMARNMMMDPNAPAQHLRPVQQQMPSSQAMRGQAPHRETNSAAYPQAATVFGVYNTTPSPEPRPPPHGQPSVQPALDQLVSAEPKADTAVPKRRGTPVPLGSYRTRHTKEPSESATTTVPDVPAESTAPAIPTEPARVIPNLTPINSAPASAASSRAPSANNSVPAGPFIPPAAAAQLTAMLFAKLNALPMDQSKAPSGLDVTASTGSSQASPTAPSTPAKAHPSPAPASPEQPASAKASSAQAKAHPPSPTPHWPLWFAEAISKLDNSKRNETAPGTFFAFSMNAGFAPQQRVPERYGPYV